MVDADGTSDTDERAPLAPPSRDRGGDNGARSSPSSRSLGDPGPRGDVPGPRGDDVPIEFPERDPTGLDDTTELHVMERHADDDGTVTVQILGWEREERDDTEPGAGSGAVVRVEYALPTGRHETDRYCWPTPGRYAESDFVSLVRGLGYAPSAADHVVGEFARARNENGRWRIVTGRRNRSESRTGTDRRRRTDGAGARRNAAGGGDVGGTGRSDSRVSRWTRRRLVGVDPMDIGLASVLLAFLSVLVPAAAAVPAGGLTTPIAVLGMGLFAAAVATLWLSIVVAAT